MATRPPAPHTKAYQSIMGPLWQRDISTEMFVIAEKGNDIPMNIDSETDLILRAQTIARGYGKIWDKGLGRIMKFWVGPPTAFPVKGRKKVEAIGDVDDEYLLYYIARYYREREGGIVMQAVATQPDPAVDVVISAYKNIPPEDLGRICKAHRLSMQAENIVGKLLERYVARLLESKGWVWCAGETLRSVDFMTGEDTADVKLLQIKNRSNSENSASSAIRAGTTIKKWYRINSTTGTTRWQLLPENEDGTCSEKGFYEFVKEEAKGRPAVEEVPLEEAIAQEAFASNENAIET